ncbi:late gene regulator [Escherichia coli]|nr:late gene regulator [Escherichia coli]
MSKRKMAELLNEVHPEWCFSTCEKRIANWLAVAEYALYIPMRESFAQKMS